jgi:hypothetical protein
VAEDAVAGHAAALAQVAAADHDVRLAAQHGRDDALYLAGHVLAVGVEGEHGGGPERGRGAEAAGQGDPFAPVALVPHHGGPGGRGHRRRLVRRAVVDDDDGVHVLAHLEDDAADEARFVVGGNDGDDLRLGVLAWECHLLLTWGKRGGEPGAG